MVAQLSKMKGIIEANREHQRFKDSGSSSYSSSNLQTIRIEMPTNGKLIDFKNHGLLFDMAGSCDAGAQTNIAFNNYAASTWIREVRFYAGNNQIGKALKRYNGYCRMNFDLKANDEWASSYGYSEGAKAGSETNTATSIASRQYIHTFQSGIPTCQDYFPSNKIDALRIEIDMEDANKVIFGTGASPANPVYTIQNVYVLCDLITLNGPEQTMLDKMVSSKLKINYLEYHSHIETDISGDTVINVGILDGGLKSSFYFDVLNADRNNQKDYWGFSNRNNLQSYRFKLGERDLSQYEIRVSSTRLSEYLYHLQNAMKASQGALPFELGNSNVLLTSTRFIVGQRADKNNDHDTFSSMIDGTRNKLVVDVGFESSPAASTTYVYSVLDKELEILPGLQTNNVNTNELLTERKQDLSNK